MVILDGAYFFVFNFVLDEIIMIEIVIFSVVCTIFVWGEFLDFVISVEGCDLYVIYIGSLILSKIDVVSGLVEVSFVVGL